MRRESKLTNSHQKIPSLLHDIRTFIEAARNQTAQIVYATSSPLRWSHFTEILPLQEPPKQKVKT